MSGAGHCIKSTAVNLFVLVGFYAFTIILIFSIVGSLFDVSLELE